MPQVNAVLADRGLGTLAPGKVRALPGRHSNWAGTTSAGVGVFVKQIANDAGDGSLRLQRAIRAEATQFALRHDLAAPRCLGWDVATGLMVFELLTPSCTGAQLAAGGNFHTELAAQAGRLVAALHSAALVGGPAPRFPELASFESLAWERFISATNGELEVWRLLQSDDALVDAVRLLHASQERAALAPTHCDLRLDQLLVCNARLYLTDWEELQLADPARDVGSYVGEWLRHAVYQIDATAVELSHEGIVEFAATEFQRVRPNIAAFWRAYLATSQGIDSGLAERAVAYAGWHQFDRLLAYGQAHSNLSPLERALAGVGRSALLAPHKLITAIGLDPVHD